MAEAPMLTVENLNVLYGDYQVLWDVSLTVNTATPRGEPRSVVPEAAVFWSRSVTGGSF